MDLSCFANHNSPDLSVSAKRTQFLAWGIGDLSYFARSTY